METSITARHCEISDTLRAHAASIGERIGAYAPRPIDSAVVFDVEGPQRVAELRLHLAHGEVFVAHGDGPDHRTALDRAEERLKRQVTRASDRFKALRHPQASDPV
jgi:ribosomal subunit interface protein